MNTDVATYFIDLDTNQPIRSVRVLYDCKRFDRIDIQISETFGNCFYQEYQVVEIRKDQTSLYGLTIERTIVLLKIKL